MFLLSEHYRLIASSLPKIMMEIAGESPMVGTGICIAPGLILTCAHVVLGKARLSDISDEDLADWHALYSRRISSMTVIDQDGRDYVGVIEYCDPALDAALIRTPLIAPPLAVDGTALLEPGVEIAYFGYPYTIQNNEREWPFSVLRGMVSSKVEVCVGGSEKRLFAVIQGLVLGGISGGPVIDATTGKLLGMINGQMNWGRDDVLIAQRDEEGNPHVADTDTPLPVGFATPFSFLHERGFPITSPSTPA